MSCIGQNKFGSIDLEIKPFVLPKTLSEEDMEELAKEEELVAKIHKETENYPVTELALPTPCPGTLVTYGIDGGILRIEYPEESAVARYSPLPQGTRKPVGVYRYPSGSNTQKPVIGIKS